MGPDVAARQALGTTPILIFVLCVFSAAYLTVNPRLFHLRLWAIPIALQSIWSLCTNYAFSDPWLNTFNFGTCVVGFTMMMKLIELVGLNEPPKYDGQLPCSRQSALCGACALNTISYLVDVRCLHWNNVDSPCHIPVDTRRDGTHLEFCTDTLVLFLKHLFYLDTLHALFANVGTLGLPQGDTIFRDTFAITSSHTIHLPHPLIGAFILAFGVGLVVMNSMSAGHYLITLLVAPLTWLPSLPPHSLSASYLKREWPPLFDDPPNATSLRDFWSNRWHAVFRRNFWSAGGKPGVAVGRFVGGAADDVVQSFSVRNINSRDESVQKEGRISSRGARMGGVMGVFLMSGLLHDFGMWGMGQGMDFCRVTGYFLIQGVGLIVESALGLGRAVKPEGDRHVGNGVGSVANGKASADVGSAAVPAARFMNLWTLVWVVLPATMMVDAWLQRGLAGIVIVPHSLSPARALLRLWNDFAFAQ